MGNTLGGNHDPVTSKTTERGQSYVQNIQYAASGMKGLRATMEDKHLYTHQLRVDGVEEAMTDHSLFAVFDGHGGDFTSGYAAEHFLSILARQPEMKKYIKLAKTGSGSRSDVTGIELLRSALDAVFSELDVKLRQVQQQKNDAIDNMPQDPNDESLNAVMGQTYEHSGSTCVVVLLTPSHVIGCNAGDSRAVLRRAGYTLPLSFDHKPSEVSEKDRITEAGGFVKARRVDGDLAVSRALGDFVYKTNDSLPANKQKVIPNPDFVVYPRSLEKDEFIILACDGIWDVASSKQCSDFVQQLLVEGESDLGIICEEALDTCLERNSKDNMTILIVGLPGMQKPNSAVKLQNAVLGRKALRQAKAFNMQASQLVSQFGILSSSDNKNDSESNGRPSNAFASHLQNTVAAAPIAAA
jgi:serine/threonine protein phosphatase PrpC